MNIFQCRKHILQFIVKTIRLSYRTENYNIYMYTELFRIWKNQMSRRCIYPTIKFRMHRMMNQLVNKITLMPILTLTFLHSISLAYNTYSVKSAALL